MSFIISIALFMVHRPVLTSADKEEYPETISEKQGINSNT